MSNSLEDLVNKIKSGEDLSNISCNNEKEIVKEKSSHSTNIRSIENNSFESLMKNSDKLDHYDDSYKRYHGIGRDKIKGYDPDNPLEEVGTSFLGLVKVLVIFFIGIYLISKW
ncbi:hypothetical protein [Acinetobacter sp. WCHA29]|uniref:hypothetical protein n=1 Tax=Acinetobacter sp. WCHA29 TaxID=2004649 RepID=UPI000B3C7E2E|nr:hypothetical protein [Acinetobacter sp. WCHA29]